MTHKGHDTRSCDALAAHAKKATVGLVSEFDLAKAAINAQRRGIMCSAEEFAVFNETASKMARELQAADEDMICRLIERFGPLDPKPAPCVEVVDGD